jgi:hypothetical protein
MVGAGGRRSGKKECDSGFCVCRRLIFVAANGLGRRLVGRGLAT